MKKNQGIHYTTLLAMSLSACTTGQGDVNFTLWGEEYVLDRIPAQSGTMTGFVDGWSVQYSKVLLNFEQLSLGQAVGGVTQQIVAGAKIYDIKQIAAPLVIGKLRNVPAMRWDKVGFKIVPATANSQSGNADSADVTAMRTNGWAVYLEGTATHPTKGTYQFAWGFTQATAYNDCVAADDTLGLVVRPATVSTAAIVIHVDHPFYDHLSSPTAVLRFDALANADTNGDRRVTLEELDAVFLVDLPRDQYGGAGEIPNVRTLRAFVTALISTVGHFDGEGHCHETRL